MSGILHNFAFVITLIAMKMNARQRIWRRAVATAMSVVCAIGVKAAPPVVEYSATVMGNSSTGDFAPYMIGSWNGGRLTRSHSALLDVEAHKSLDESRRFDYSFGAEVVTGYQSATDYARYDAASATWTTSHERPAAIWLQQLYAEIKYRSLFLSVGMKDNQSKLLDESLSSGDLTRSNNARAIPGATVGFIDFQNIPLTNGWVQIAGEIYYGRSMDKDFVESQHNRYNGVMATDLWYTYKYCYFRTKPSKPFSVTLGMQTAGQFGGSTLYYRRGEQYAQEVRGFHFKDIFEMFLPREGTGEGYYKGNTLGTWDFKARYRLRDGKELYAYFQGPWEDGSGIGRKNGFDGLWGLEYDSGKPGLITGAAIEYLDFCNQSGPMHWAPNDAPGTDIIHNATGGDNYYNNDFYMSYSNYGMAIATPFVKAPLYNLDGQGRFAHNRSRGFHAAMRGNITSDCDYRVMVSYQKAWGTGRIPQAIAMHNTSAMAEATWRADRWLPGLSLKAQVAFDAGDLRGDNFGAMVAVKYSGSLFNKKK